VTLKCKEMILSASKKPVEKTVKNSRSQEIDYRNMHAIVAMQNIQLGKAVMHFLRDNQIGSCVMATTAQKAIEHMHKNRASLFFVDYELPNLGGVDFVKFLRMCDGPVSEAFVVMVISAPDIDKVGAARDCGSHEILGLPLTTKLMNTRLTHMIGKPKPFIRHPAYTGPCRRRERVKIYHGEDRRSKKTASVQMAPQRQASVRSSEAEWPAQSKRRTAG